MLWGLDKAIKLFQSESGEPRLFKPGRPSQGDPPQKPGLYRLIRKDNGEVLYIGQASNLAQRIRAHKNHFLDMEWVVAWKTIETCFTGEAYDLLRDMERKQIDRHRPKGNATKGGEGAPPRTERCSRWLWQCRHLGECRRWQESS